MFDWKNSTRPHEKKKLLHDLLRTFLGLELCTLDARSQLKEAPPPTRFASFEKW
jgi:hypothetical protein